MGADPAWFIFKNLHVIGTMVGSMKDTDKALDFAARVCVAIIPRSAAVAPKKSNVKCTTDCWVGAPEADIREVPDQQVARGGAEAAGRQGRGQMCGGFQFVVASWPTCSGRWHAFFHLPVCRPGGEGVGRYNHKCSVRTQRCSIQRKSIKGSMPMLWPLF